MSIHSSPLLLEGTPRQRGRIHGEALRAEIRDVVGRWFAELERNGKNPTAFLKEFHAARNFQPAFQRWVPGVMDEIEGIAEGANLDLDTIYALQLLDEMWVYEMEGVLGRLQDSPPHHCSGLGCFGEGSPPLIAQNMDLPGYLHRNQVMLRIRQPQDDLDALVFTYAGCIAVNVLNQHGVGVCLNTLIQLEACADGLPVTGVLRGLMACRTAAEAERFIRSVRHASGQNYIVGSPQGVTSYECSANRVAVFAPLPTRTWHTNHPLVNDDSARFQRLLEREREKTMDTFKNTYDRLAFMEREVGDLSQPLTVERAKQILASHETPVCRDYEDDQHSLTFGCLVMTLDKPPRLQVSFGPGCSTLFHEYGF